MNADNLQYATLVAACCQSYFPRMTLKIVSGASGSLVRGYSGTERLIMVTGLNIAGAALERISVLAPDYSHGSWAQSWHQMTLG